MTSIFLLYLLFAYMFNFGRLYMVTVGFKLKPRPIDHFMFLAAPITFPLNLGVESITFYEDENEDDDQPPMVT